MLVNTLKEGEHGTDLISEEKFWNFTVRFEYQVPKASNSGFYLRGRHEIQILEDAAGRKLADGGNGAIYSIKPMDIFVSRKAGEWQEVEVKKATGSELDTELDQPGPILLQGDHGAVAFRNVRIKVLD